MLEFEYKHISVNNCRSNGQHFLVYAIRIFPPTKSDPMISSLFLVVITLLVELLWENCLCVCTVYATSPKWFIAHIVLVWWVRYPSNQTSCDESLCNNYFVRHIILAVQCTIVHHEFLRDRWCGQCLSSRDDRNKRIILHSRRFPFSLCSTDCAVCGLAGRPCIRATWVQLLTVAFFTHSISVTFCAIFPPNVTLFLSQHISFRFSFVWLIV